MEPARLLALAACLSLAVADSDLHAVPLLLKPNDETGRIVLAPEGLAVGGSGAHPNKPWQVEAAGVTPRDHCEARRRQLPRRAVHSRQPSGGGQEQGQGSRKRGEGGRLEEKEEEGRRQKGQEEEGVINWSSGACGDGKGP